MEWCRQAVKLPRTMKRKEGAMLGGVPRQHCTARGVGVEDCGQFAATSDDLDFNVGSEHAALTAPPAEVRPELLRHPADRETNKC